MHKKADSFWFACSAVQTGATLGFETTCSVADQVLHLRSSRKRLTSGG